jgi:hypothetical protein
MRIAIACLSLAACAARQSPSAVGDERQRLLLRIARDPQGTDANLALARYDAQHQRPASALRHFTIADRNGGLFGSKLTDHDRSQAGQLILARGRRRLSAEQASAQRDFDQARVWGVVIAANDSSRLEAVKALSNARHASNELRARGLTSMCKLQLQPGACSAAATDERQIFGQWLWQHGAKRAGYEVLSSLTSPRVPLHVQAWWHGDVSSAALGFQQTCDAFSAIDELARDGSDDGYAAFVQRSQTVVNAARARRQLPIWSFAICQSAAGRDQVAESSAANEAKIDGATFIVSFAARWRWPERQVQQVIETRSSSPQTVDQLVADIIDRSSDESWDHAASAELFDIIGDPARARDHWRVAYEQTSEPSYALGFAVALAHAGDPDAAAIWATTAAAANGDPSPAIVEVARAMMTRQSWPEALTQLRQARSLASATDAATVERYIAEALHGLGRPAQDDYAVVQSDDSTSIRDALLPTASMQRRLAAIAANPSDVELRSLLLLDPSTETVTRQQLARQLAAHTRELSNPRARPALRALYQLRNQ